MLINRKNTLNAWSGKSFFLLLLLFAFGCSQVVNAQAKFYASAPKSVPVNQGFQLSYTLENANGGNLKLPPMNDFQLIGGPSTSTNMQWINGNVTQSVTYTYILKPKKEGTFKIGKASVQVSGVTMESNELTVEITQAVAQQQQQQRQRNPFDPFADDPFFNPQAQPEPEVSQADLEKQVKDDVFIKLVVNKSSVYKGEMLTATYKLYFRQNLSGFNVTKAPAFDGFWSQEVELDPQRRPTVENINGKQYNAVDILQYNLYPQRAGNLSVASTEISTVAQVSVRGRSRNFFDDFFNVGRVQQIPLTLKTNEATVQVKELPENGKPADFNGAVGKFNFEAKLSNNETKTDEPITYTFKVSGTGNLKFIESPIVTMPLGFEVYDPKVKENISNSTAGLSGSKQYDYLIIPRQPGEYKIKSKSFSYFDPSAAKYFTINSPEFTVKVTGEPSKNVNASATTATAKEEVAVLGNDIRYIKTTLPEFRKSNSVFASASVAALYSAPFLMFIGLVALKKRNENLAADVVGTKRRRALKLAKKRLSVADKLLAQNDKKGFYNEVSRAVWGYLSDKLNIDMASLSKENVEEKLLARSVHSETIGKLKSLLNTCELALYSPVGEGGEMKHNYETAMNLMADFEDEIKG
ncbi:MAG: protein BatD [Chitinophagales bacterium]|nr:protein BatD [Chitinophagales bacterium]